MIHSIILLTILTFDTSSAYGMPLVRCDVFYITITLTERTFFSFFFCFVFVFICLRFRGYVYHVEVCDWFI